MGVSSKEKAEFASDHLKEVVQVWFILLKENRSIESGPIECEEFMEELLETYFPCEKREIVLRRL